MEGLLFLVLHDDDNIGGGGGGISVRHRPR